MKTVCYFLVLCVSCMCVSATPQVFYTPIAGHIKSSPRQYYAVEYLQHSPSQDFDLNHGEVDAPHEYNDDDSADDQMENSFYNNGLVEVANDDEIDALLMPYDVDPASDGDFIPQNDTLSEIDDEDTHEEVVEEFLDDDNSENQSILQDEANDPFSSEETTTEESTTEKLMNDEENTESSIELDNNDNNNSSSTTEMPHQIIQAFVHPIHRPSSEWALEAALLADLRPKPGKKPFTNPQGDGQPIKRIQNPQKTYRKRIRIITKRRKNSNRLNNGMRFRNVGEHQSNEFVSRGNSGSSLCGSCQCGVTTSRRIKSGEVAAVNEFPWLALINYNDTIQCGGTLINDRYVLTAAHCVRGFDIKLFQLQFLEYNIARKTDTVSVLRKISRIYSLKSYEAKTSNNDISILRLARPIKFETTTVRPICLPRHSRDFIGETGIIAGWESSMTGDTPSNIVQKTEVPIISNQQCLLVGLKITSKMLCAGRLLDGSGINGCHGESGGPLMVIINKRYHLAGVISWGDGCARPNKPGIYTRATQYLPWINKKTTGSCKCR